MSSRRRSGLEDIHFYDIFLVPGDFDFEQKFLVSAFPRCWTLLSLNKKFFVPGFFPVLATLSLSEKIPCTAWDFPRYWGARGAK